MATATVAGFAGTNGAAAPVSQQQAEQPAGLWSGLDIEVIGGTGEFGQGKSIFGLTIDPKNTLVYDNEGSTTIYKSLGFERCDMAVELLKRHPNGYKPIDRFKWWREDVKKRVTPGRYSVVMVDPISEIESGLQQYVRENPGEYGYTKAQFDQAAPLFWGAYKDAWKAILDDLRIRCQTFYFVVHMRDEFKGGRPTGKREAKGKETLFELASLYLEFERKADDKGNVPDVPAAKVLKSRLAHTRMAEDGSVQIIPILPPRLPKATPTAIRQYIATPPDYSKLKKGELLQDEHLSDDAKLLLQSQIAADQKETASIEFSRAELMAQQAQRQANQQQAGTAATKPATDQSAQRAATTQQKTIATAEQFAADEAAKNDLRNQIMPLIRQAYEKPEEFRRYLEQTYSASVLMQMTVPQLREVLEMITKRVADKAAAGTATPPAGQQEAEKIAAATPPVSPAEKELADRLLPETAVLSPQPGTITESQREEIAAHIKRTGWPIEGPKGQREYLKARGCDSPRSLSAAQAGELIGKLAAVPDRVAAQPKN